MCNERKPSALPYFEEITHNHIECGWQLTCGFPAETQMSSVEHHALRATQNLQLIWSSKFYSLFAQMIHFRKEHWQINYTPRESVWTRIPFCLLFQLFWESMRWATSKQYNELKRSYHYRRRHFLLQTFPYSLNLHQTILLMKQVGTEWWHPLSTPRHAP